MNKISEINVICVGDLRYRFDYEKIERYDFEYKPDVLRIDFKDGSFIEFNRDNIIAVEVNTEDCCLERYEK